ncbi:hypothetical protein M0D21_11795 [Aquimarina sp. D1M17]|uniref:hypothetical protein n=1 Tax=Aquimarina acroporae TaxID=2937283 RepID=UPI0020BFA361|nr:hypothetical protein [Aquimarina acroporae]MCK8522257.1 hypothetical protein [Aquimarina acroporae]
MLSKILTSRRYWSTVAFIGLGFVVVISVIEHLRQYGGVSWSSFLEDYIHNGKWVRYILSRLIGGLLYGMIMGYYFELRKQRSKR